MTRTAFIQEQFAAGQRKALHKILSDALGPRVDVQSYLATVESEVAVYKALTKPMDDELKEQIGALEQFSDAARQFSRAGTTISDDALGLIEQRRLSAERSRGAIPEWGAESELTYRETFAVTLERAKRYATYARDVQQSLKKRHGSARRAEQSLLAEIVMAYCVAFGVRPAASENGTFVTTTQRILQAAGVTISLSDERVARLLLRGEFQIFPKPPRGRRPRS